MPAIGPTNFREYGTDLSEIYLGINDASHIPPTYYAAGSNPTSNLVYGIMQSSGVNTYGQLGRNIATTTTSVLGFGPVVNAGSLIAERDWVMVAASYYHANAIDSLGNLWGWGDGADGGDHGLNNTNTYSVPFMVSSPALSAGVKWVYVDAFEGGGCALDSTGKAWAWGQNNIGQVGAGTANSPSLYSKPTAVSSNLSWSYLSAGGAFILGLSGGGLYSWGQNNSGQLGQGDIVHRSSPLQIGALTTWSNAGGGISHSLGIQSNGTLWSWGYGVYGQLGSNAITSRSSPVQVGSSTAWCTTTGLKLASPDGYWSSAIQNGGSSVPSMGSLFMWGQNQFGYLGVGDINNRSSPTQVGALNNWMYVSGGGTFAVALRADGTFWGWGSGSAGMLGASYTSLYSSPVQIASGNQWKQIRGGYNTTYAISWPMVG